MQNSVTEIIVNAPFPVHFAGFESTTVKLQRAGWELAVNQSPNFYAGETKITLAMHYPTSGESFYAISHGLDFRNWQMEIQRGNHQAFRNMIFQVQCVNNNIQCQYVMLPHGAMTYGFKAFDAISYGQEMASHHIKSLRDIVPFKTLNPDSSEIWIPKNKISEAMDRIIELQVPKQKEIRESQRKAEDRERVRNELNGNQNKENITAQIYVA